MAKRRASASPKAKVKGKTASKSSSGSWFKNLGATILRFCIKTLIYFFIFSFLFTLMYRFVPVPFTPLMFIRVIEQKLAGKPMKLKKDWVSIEESGPMPIAAMAGEDAKFMDHIGFDFNAINKAVDYNKTHKRKKGRVPLANRPPRMYFYGLAELGSEKGLEVYFTLLIELLWSKERILEVYINVIEMGDGIYGVEAASQYYFKKPATKMTRMEAAKIASILPNPLKWSVKKPSPYLVARQNWIRNNMDYIKGIDF